MTKGKAAYWISTTLLCLLYAAGAFFYLTQRSMAMEGYTHFGYPSYLINLLIVAKIAAPVAILSRMSIWVSDLAYSGIFFHLLLAISAHLNVGDGGFFPAVLMLMLLAVSFLTQNLSRKVASPNVPHSFGLSVSSRDREESPS